jgi:CRP/FNR family transcriptional regulator, cyclic AMP receptor protein
VVKIRGGALPAGAWPRSSLLGRLKPDDCADLLSIGTRCVFPDRHPIIRQGADEDHVVLLTKGLTKVVVYTENGHEALLAVRVGGDLVGEMASLEKRPRSATVISCVRTSAQLIPADLFDTFLDRHPRVFYQVTRMLSERLRWANDRRVAFAALPAPARVAGIIVELAQTYGRCTGGNGWELGVPLSHAELASFAGVSLSSTEKALFAFRKSGAIARSRQIAIADMAALRDLARPPAEDP